MLQCGVWGMRRACGCACVRACVHACGRARVRACVRACVRIVAASESLPVDILRRSASLMSSHHVPGVRGACVWPSEWGGAPAPWWRTALTLALTPTLA